MKEIINVSLRKQKELKKRMEELEILEKDLEESFVRSSGPGGQRTNKTSTCVFLRHIPTGITVKCQESRTQTLNRFLARRRLLDLLEKEKKGYIEEERKYIEKIRRQKRRRSKRAKEKCLKEKKIKSEKKKMRAKIEIIT